MRNNKIEIPMENYEADVIIAGGGIAGLITAYELLKKGKKVIIFDKDIQENLGGLAKEALAGIHLMDTPHQKRNRIKDSKELAYSDWLRMAKFDKHEIWPRRWAEFYCYNATDDIYAYYKEVGLKFIIVQWTERGLYRPGNTVPRFHITWGTGFELANKTIEAIDNLPQRANLQILFEHEVNDVQQTEGRVKISGRNMQTGEVFEASGEQAVIASGGIGGGDLSYFKEKWRSFGKSAPEYMLNGAHKFGDGLLHRKIEERGGVLTNLQNNWPYAAGVHHPNPRKPFDGISLQPGPGVLWFNALGERIGPQPLMTSLDNPWLVDQVLNQPGQYTWLVLNWKLAIRDLQVALSRYFAAIRARNVALLVRNALLGDEPRINLLLNDSPEDVFLADNLDILMDKMQERSLYDLQINRTKLKADIEAYDDLIDRGPAYRNDEQLRQIVNFRAYFPDRFRSSKFKKILDPHNGPLMAIRSFIISRKSMGGIQTDLRCRVLKKDGEPFDNIYAVGEAAGYGGGGIHGKGGPEGSWLGGCILTARVCGRAID
jgi:predicted oxidoreductase